MLVGLLCAAGVALAAPAAKPSSGSASAKKRWQPQKGADDTDVEDKLLRDEKLLRRTMARRKAAAKAEAREDGGGKQNLLFGLGALLILVFGFTHSTLSARRERKRALALHDKAQTEGLFSPPSLHPVIDADLCIGCGTCVRNCPDQSVLGLMDGIAHLVTAANCVGHGLCQKNCPADAIQLVFGTLDRPLDLPRYDGRYQSVDGIYVAGELGGMGLIANAFDQALEAMNYLRDDLKTARAAPAGVHDVLIVGAGPAGLAGALRAHELGLDYRCVDQDSWGGAIRAYPRAKLVMTRPLRVPLYGPVKLRETSKEALVELWDQVVEQTGVRIQTQTRVETVARASTHFVVQTTRGEILARRILLALGRRGTPRKLGVPGEEQSHVAYTMLDPELWAGHAVAVVGGGDMACEIALALAEQAGTEVTLLYRGEALSRPKSANREKVQAAVEAARLRLVLQAEIVEVRPDALLARRAGGPVRRLPVSQVFACLGGIPPTKFLTSIGIEVVALRGQQASAP